MESDEEKLHKKKHDYKKSLGLTKAKMKKLIEEELRVYNLRLH